MICRHRRITWPMSTRGRLTVECLDCLKRMPYDWQSMRVVKPPMFTGLRDWITGRAYARALRGFAK